MKTDISSSSGTMRLNLSSHKTQDAGPTDCSPGILPIFLTRNRLHHVKKLRMEDITFQNWRLFYKVSFIIISVVTVFMFLDIDKTLRLALLILAQLIYLPWVVNEFLKVMKKKKD